MERLAGRLVDLACTGIDVSDLGDGPVPVASAAWTPLVAGFYFLVAPRDPPIFIVRVVPPFDAL
ncbi:hypothetical protein ACH4PU_08490 [Streptomyces sp. NPDC021100]|uniref:hypothetical protein n=1 Tax=Streptomyces sp. NPDC021100 TaxID=3365114 RepID=UPI00378F7CC8